MSKPQRPRLSPEEASIVRAQLMSRRTSRRAVLGGMGAVGVAAGLAPAAPAARAEATPRSPQAVTDRSDTDKVVNWANWTLYLDYDDKTKTYPTLEEFQQRTDIKATYAEDIEDNDSYYGKIQGQLKNGDDIGKDIVVFTDYMAARVIRQGYMQKLDKNVIPKAANILDDLRDVDFDPGRNYSLTWQSGYAGLAWNKAEFDKLGLPAPTNVSDLWNPKLKGRVEVLSEFRDTVGPHHARAGRGHLAAVRRPSSSTPRSRCWRSSSPTTQIRQVKGNSYKEDLISGDALAVHRAGPVTSRS